MDDAFSQSLADWTAFYALMGGAAATLLGLLFVALSVRLNIFHQREVADVRDFAAFTFGTFLVAIAVAGLAIAPHAHRSTLALSLLLVCHCRVLRHRGGRSPLDSLERPSDWSTTGLRPCRMAGLAVSAGYERTVHRLDRRGGAVVAITSRCAGLAGGRRGVVPGHGHRCRLGDALPRRWRSSFRRRQRKYWRIDQRGSAVRNRCDWRTCDHRRLARANSGVSLLLDAGVAAVDEEHQEDDQTVEDLLPGGLDADDLQHVLQQDHGDRPGDGPGVAAGAAENRGATDDHRGDGRQHVEIAHPEVALLRVPGEHDPAQTGTEPAEGVRQHQHPAHRDAGEIARLRVVADGVEPLAVDGAAQQEDQRRAEEGPEDQRPGDDPADLAHRQLAGKGRRISLWRTVRVDQA